MLLPHEIFNEISGNFENPRNPFGFPSRVIDDIRRNIQNIWVIQGFPGETYNLDERISEAYFRYQNQGLTVQESHEKVLDLFIS